MSGPCAYCGVAFSASCGIFWRCIFNLVYFPDRKGKGLPSFIIGASHFERQGCGRLVWGVRAICLNH